MSTCAGSPFYAGAPTLFPNGITAVTTLSTTSGAPFSLAGISLAPLYTGFPSGSALFTGMLQGGGVVTQTFTIAGESGATPTLQSFAFSPAFTNLSSVTFAEGGGGGSLYQFTNVAVTTASTVSTTPEPGTLALLSTGLIALLPTARKRRR